MFDPAVVDPMVDVLVALAGEGPALELGVVPGTKGIVRATFIKSL